MTVIQHRRGTTAEWAASSYILEAGEIGIEIDTSTNPDTVIGAKIGNGESLWSALSYVGGGALAENGIPTGGTAGQILAKDTATDYDASWIDNYAPDIRQIVINQTGSAMTKGQAVYITSSDNSSDTPRVALAKADAESTSSKTLGLLFENINNGSSGYVIETGLLKGVDTSSATTGTAVWLSATTAGGLVFGTPPTAPNHMVYLGVVTRSHAVNGAIYVKVQNGYELQELHNVSLDGSIADNEVLAYDSASGLWKNQTAAEAGLATPSDVSTAISNLVASAPSTLDTLNELAAALGNDANFATTVTNSLANKQPLDGDLTAIAALTGTSGLLKKTAADTWTLDTNSYYLSSNPSGYTSNTGTVTSVGLTVPTGLSVSAQPVTSSGTIAITLQSGYSIPTTIKQTNWDTAYTDRNNWDGSALANGGTQATARTSLGLGTMAVETATDYLTTSTASSTYLPITPIEIPNSADLNTYTTSGTYVQSSNAEAAAGTNYPAALAGTLRVVANSNTSEVWQTYHTLGGASTNKVYQRGFYITWSAWKEVVTTDGGTFTGSVALNGGFSVDSTAFSVADTTGDTSIAGNLAINTNKFNVTASSGNTTIAGTLGVTGAITASGGITGANGVNMTVASGYTNTGGFLGTNVIMTATASGQTAPTTRPGGGAGSLQAGDIWISW